MLNPGRTIKILRQAREMSLTQLANDAGVSVPFLSLIESEGRQPSLAVIRRLAKALAIPPEALILLAATEGERLYTSDETAKSLAESIRKLAKAEEDLRKKLEAGTLTSGPKEAETM